MAFVSDRGKAEPGWIVYLTGRPQALEGRHAMEFEAMEAAEAACGRMAIPPASAASGKFALSSNSTFGIVSTLPVGGPRQLGAVRRRPVGTDLHRGVDIESMAPQLFVERNAGVLAAP